jgi:hypothetical protein
MRALLPFGWMVLAFTSTAAAAAPSDMQVDLEVVLAVDVSASMDANEQRIQRQGYVEAFRSPDVLHAIASGVYGRIAVTYVEWSSALYQVVVMPWRVLSNQEDMDAFANDLERAPISREGATSISGVLASASRMFAASGFDSDRRTIDISGDGANNDGAFIVPTRDRVLQQGIAINGLPILISPSPLVGNVRIDNYYRDCVIGGPGAFVIPIQSPSDFAPATRRKLIEEIAMNQARPAEEVQQVQLQVVPPAGLECLAGEQSRALGYPP